MTIRGINKVRAACGVFAAGLLLQAVAASNHSPGRRTVQVGTGAAVSTAPLGFGSAPSATPPPSSGADATTAVKEAFTSPMVALRSIEEPASPALAQRGRAMSTAEISTSTASLMAAGSQLIFEHFSGQAATTEERLLRTSVASSVSPGPNAALVGSGISNIQFTSLTVTATAATVHATVTVWAKMRLRSLTGPMHTLGPWTTVTPSNKEAFVDMMLLQNGSWVVVTNSWQYVPGYGP